MKDDFKQRTIIQNRSELVTNNLFYVILDEDKPGLSHREQLVLALSHIQTKKPKASAWLFTRYRSIMQPQDKKSIQKIAALLSISEILEKVKKKVRFIKGDRREILLTLLPSKNIPPIRLMENALKMLQEAFGIIVSYSIFSSPMDIGLKAEIITMASVDVNKLYYMEYLKDPEYWDGLGLPNLLNGFIKLTF